MGKTAWRKTEATAALAHSPLPSGAILIGPFGCHRQRDRNILKYTKTFQDLWKKKDDVGRKREAETSVKLHGRTSKNGSYRRHNTVPLPRKALSWFLLPSSPSGNSPTTQSDINGTQEYPFRWYRWRNQGSKEVGTENISPLLPSSQRNSGFWKKWHRSSLSMLSSIETLKAVEKSSYIDSWREHNDRTATRTQRNCVPA